MSIHQLSDKGPDGTSMGQSADDKISFYGAPPVVQQVLPAAATAAQIATFLHNIGLGRPT